MEAFNPLVAFYLDNDSLKGISEEGLLLQRPGQLLTV